MDFEIFQETRIGARHVNQDRIGYLYTKDCALLIVCDGMGGHFRGEIASDFVVQFIAKAFKALATPKIKDVPQFLIRSIISAHEALLRYSKKENFKEVPRTTCVLAILQDGKVSWANVGDSRIYHIRNGEILTRTHDHSHVQNLVDKGLITEEEADLHPEKNKIFNCIGQPATPRVDINENIELMTGDNLILCTDGLWSPVPMKYVASTLQRSGPSVGLKMLMDMSESVAGRECDNLSAVAMNWRSNFGNPTNGEQFIKEDSLVTDEDLDIAMNSVKSAIYGKSYLR